MNEAQNESIPAEVEANETDLSTLIDNDIKNSFSEEETSQPTTKEVSTPAETKEEEPDFTPLLEKLSKEIKYMDNEVKIENVDTLKTTFQKGLDYDRKVEKLKEYENSPEMEYIKEKAKEADMSTTDYIRELKKFEIQQQEQQEQNEIDEMVENGVSQEIARKVIETNKIAKELQAEKQKIADEKKQLELSRQKEAENELFLQAYPDIDIKSIPKEVFLEAEKTNLLTAYTQFKNKELVIEIERLKQEQNNKQTSPVKGTTEHGGVVTEKEDDFIKGLLG